MSKEEMKAILKKIQGDFPHSSKGIRVTEDRSEPSFRGPKGTIRVFAGLIGFSRNNGFYKEPFDESKSYFTHRVGADFEPNDQNVIGAIQALLRLEDSPTDVDMATELLGRPGIVDQIYQMESTESQEEKKNSTAKKENLYWNIARSLISKQYPESVLSIFLDPHKPGMNEYVSKTVLKNTDLKNTDETLLVFAIKQRNIPASLFLMKNFPECWRGKKSSPLLSLAAESKDDTLQIQMLKAIYESEDPISLRNYLFLFRASPEFTRQGVFFSSIELKSPYSEAMHALMRQTNKFDTMLYGFNYLLEVTGNHLLAEQPIGWFGWRMGNMDEKVRFISDFIKDINTLQRLFQQHLTEVGDDKDGADLRAPYVLFFLVKLRHFNVQLTQNFSEESQQIMGFLTRGLSLDNPKDLISLDTDHPVAQTLFSDKMAYFAGFAGFVLPIVMQAVGVPYVGSIFNFLCATASMGKVFIWDKNSLAEFFQEKAHGEKEPLLRDEEKGASDHKQYSLGSAGAPKLVKPRRWILAGWHGVIAAASAQSANPSLIFGKIMPIMALPGFYTVAKGVYTVISGADDTDAKQHCCGVPIGKNPIMASALPPRITKEDHHSELFVCLSNHLDGMFNNLTRNYSPDRNSELVDKTTTFDL